MRLFLLPISTRRTLLYCDKSFLPHPPIPTSSLIKPPTSSSPSQSITATSTQPSTPKISIPDRIVNKANSTWAEWEASKSGWRKTLTTYGNKAFMRIPFEEWGLKSLPSLSLPSSSSSTASSPKPPTANKASRISVLYPSTLINPAGVLPLLNHLSTSRQPWHKSRMISSVICVPLTIPFGLVPVLPNIPFFYVAFRAWSHYKALYGARWLKHMLDEGLIAQEGGNRALEGIYNKLEKREGLQAGKDQEQGQEIEKMEEEVILMRKDVGKLIATEYKLPELQIEIERAVEQVEKKMQYEKEKERERLGVNKDTVEKGGVKKE